MQKKILVILLLYFIAMPCFAAKPDPKYCTMLKQLHPNMNIGDVFLLMGPPHSFGQPPNIDMLAVQASKTAMQPQTTVSPNTPEARNQILQSMATDPILGAFMNAPAEYKNILIWQFEQDTLSVSIKVKGPIVTDVKANFSCS